MDSNPKVGYLKVQGFGHRFKSVLRCRVGAAVGRSHPSGDAADIHNHSASTLGPPREHSTHCAQGTHDVGLKLTLHEDIVDLIYRSLHLKPGVVDEYVDVEWVGHTGFDRVWIADIELPDLNGESFLLGCTS